jgi:predicted DNA-binding transcriptional regulator AlpA
MSINEPLTAAEERVAVRVAEYVLRKLRGQAMPPQSFYSIQQAAAILGISQKTLRRKHEQGVGPRAIKIPHSNLVRFHIDDLTSWWRSAQVER